MKVELHLSVFFADIEHLDFDDADEFENFMIDNGRGFLKRTYDSYEGGATGIEFLCDPRYKDVIEQWKKDKSL